MQRERATHASEISMPDGTTGDKLDASRRVPVHNFARTDDCSVPATDFEVDN